MKPYRWVRFEVKGDPLALWRGRWSLTPNYHTHEKPHTYAFLPFGDQLLEALHWTLGKEKRETLSRGLYWWERAGTQQSLQSLYKALAEAQARTRRERKIEREWRSLAHSTPTHTLAWRAKAFYSPTRTTPSAALGPVPLSKHSEAYSITPKWGPINSSPLRQHNALKIAIILALFESALTLPLICEPPQPRSTDRRGHKEFGCRSSRAWSWAALLFCFTCCQWSCFSTSCY